jgi:hypothetical protein
MAQKSPIKNLEVLYQEGEEKRKLQEVDAYLRDPARWAAVRESVERWKTEHPDQDLGQEIFKFKSRIDQRVKAREEIKAAKKVAGVPNWWMPVGEDELKGYMDKMTVDGQVVVPREK